MVPGTDPSVQEHLTRIEDDGYTILEGVIDPHLVDALLEMVLHLERETGVTASDNDFEGTSTLRLYNLLALGEPFSTIPTHESVLPLAEGVLGPECLVSTIGSIDILPGETAQPIHTDDMMLPFPWPHEPVILNSMWALTEFTAMNGATRIIPGSHRSAEPPTYGAEYDSIPAEMAPGSILVWNGSLWHGGGRNASRARRVGISMNYCVGYLRQEENQQLGIPRETVARFPQRLQELVGYSVYMGVMGHINKKSPLTLLGREPDAQMAYETEEHREALNAVRSTSVADA